MKDKEFLESELFSSCSNIVGKIEYSEFKGRNNTGILHINKKHLMKNYHGDHTSTEVFIHAMPVEGKKYGLLYLSPFRKFDYGSNVCVILPINHIRNIKSDQDHFFSLYLTQKDKDRNVSTYKDCDLEVHDFYLNENSNFSSRTLIPYSAGYSENNMGWKNEIVKKEIDEDFKMLIFHCITGNLEGVKYIVEGKGRSDLLNKNNYTEEYKNYFKDYNPFKASANQRHINEYLQKYRIEGKHTVDPVENSTDDFIFKKQTDLFNFYTSCETGDMETVRRMLDNGDINSNDINSQCPKAVINQFENYFKQSPLEIAAARNDSELFDYLMLRGARIDNYEITYNNKGDKREHDVIYYALSNNSTYVLKRIADNFVKFPTTYEKLFNQKHIALLMEKQNEKGFDKLLESISPILKHLEINIDELKDKNKGLKM